ncbi:hypothetical protein FOPG_17376 [Fusarium oxysporum f. sp. conglutinans race 2 54008]|uniref:Uncharacterized protein n=1 Tax=Fusarium oxysporum f. sp. conglutinans race 2 54008 TaxID=1089457 RepID=X0HZC4_FUSOX|nr:hypothetical protein FOPG_17376 [Fusarium oxysporum f. sp. conglutinans race 2 54008]
MSSTAELANIVRVAAVLAAAGKVELKVQPR